MDDVCIISDNIITSLGFTTEENLNQIQSDHTGIRLREDTRIASEPFYASLVNREELSNRFSLLENPDRYTCFEQLAICSIHDALSYTDLDLKDKRTLFILSTTKGNVDLLQDNRWMAYDSQRLYLWHTAKIIQSFFSFANTPLVISNACISGLMAIIAGARLIRSGNYDHVIVTGTDVISEFIYSGFNSFKSLSQGPCRPFDKTRDGLSLGEGSGTVVITSKQPVKRMGENIYVGFGFSSNDANHISGPSRTGEGLYIAIEEILKHFDGSIDLILAHGTGTPYNDEMEAVSITRAGLQHVPVTGMKGYWGHTLGAAGVIESVAALHSIKNRMLINTLGYHEQGVSHPINVVHKTGPANISSCLKTASGFGGCNAALMLYR